MFGRDERETGRFEYKTIGFAELFKVRKAIFQTF
jgi:hypothetical protein